jgi:Raf kinase inhibitor-like YbhB/YbcL family protein
MAPASDTALSIEVSGFAEGAPIPGVFAFCVPAASGHVTLGPNRNPRVHWSGAPQGTRSYALLCVDADAPTVGDNVNKEGVTVPASLPRADFSHWVLVDIPVGVTEIAEAADADGVVARGKPAGATAYGVRGRNDYTGWFADDADMAGTYAGYDGPCPPWNDEVVHRYTFTVYALDVDSLGLSGDFGLAEARGAMAGHVLAEASQLGTYTLNPDRGATPA